MRSISTAMGEAAAELPIVDSFYEEKNDYMLIFIL
jgi:hypothetical protein